MFPGNFPPGLKRPHCVLQSRRETRHFAPKPDAGSPPLLLMLMKPVCVSLRYANCCRGSGRRSAGAKPKRSVGLNLKLCVQKQPLLPDRRPIEASIPPRRAGIWRSRRASSTPHTSSLGLSADHAGPLTALALATDLDCFTPCATGLAALSAAKRKQARR